MFWILKFLFVFQAFSADLPVDLYTEKIQPIFDSRCVSCHSCMNAPCQLNLQNFDGFLRGANKFNVYNGTRIDAVAPTRLWIDAHTKEAWEKLGFYSMNNSSDPNENLFFQMIAAKAGEKSAPTKIVSESQYCAATPKDQKVAMPYALPSLQDEQVKTLEAWIKMGAPGPTKKTL